MAVPFSLGIFVADGDPDGLRVAARDELGETAVYCCPVRARLNP